MNKTILSTTYPITVVRLEAHEQEFIDGYKESFYFAELGGENQPPAGIEYSEELERLFTVDCLAFLAQYKAYLMLDFVEATFEQAGHDFYLTRQRHGCGFWCRPDAYYGTAEVILTKGAEKFPPLHPHIDVTSGLLYA